MRKPSRPTTKTQHKNAIRAFRKVVGETSPPPDGLYRPVTELHAKLALAKTQLDKATVIVRWLGGIPGLVAAAKAMTEVVGMAQNGPPDGAADGTIHEPLWYALRDTATALDKFNRYIEQALTEVDIGEARARSKKLRERT